MSDPTVCAIMLTKDRAEMARRTVECFRAQTYQNKRLMVFDTSGDYRKPFPISLRYVEGGNEMLYQSLPVPNTIGSMRNMANRACLPVESEIFIHWDDDDWSHPNRIAEQVALLQYSGADCVGYREVLFWLHSDCVARRELERGEKEIIQVGKEMYRFSRPFDVSVNMEGEAYRYTNHDPRYVIGSSMCYWRRSWEARPFEDVNREEDGRWWRAMRDEKGGKACVGVSSIASDLPDMEGLPHPWRMPRMICRVHAGNAKHYDLDTMIVENSTEWRRAPEWDAKCREVMG